MNLYKDILDVTWAPEDIATVTNALSSIEQVIARYFTSMPKEEAKRLLKIGMKTEAFSYRALEIGKLNQGLLPRNLDLERIERDVAAREVLLVQFARIQQLHDIMQSALAVLGADFYAGARAVYRALKANGREAGLESLLAELGAAFERTVSKKEDASAVPGISEAVE